eukprot:746229-Hanusia_phi.AAC.11
MSKNLGRMSIRKETRSIATIAADPEPLPFAAHTNNGDRAVEHNGGRRAASSAVDDAYPMISEVSEEEQVSFAADVNPHHLVELRSDCCSVVVAVALRQAFSPSRANAGVKAQYVRVGGSARAWNGARLNELGAGSIGAVRCLRGIGLISVAQALAGCVADSVDDVLAALALQRPRDAGHVGEGRRSHPPHAVPLRISHVDPVVRGWYRNADGLAQLCGVYGLLRAVHSVSSSSLQRQPYVRLCISVGHPGAADHIVLRV